MDTDMTLPFRGSDVVRRGITTWGRLNGKDFRRIGFDTYVAAEVPDSALLQVRALLVRAGPRAVATGWSACVVLGLDVAPRTATVEIAVPDGRLDPVPGTVVRRQRIPSDETTTKDGVPTTTALRTALDLGCRSGPDLRAFDRVIDPLIDAVVAVDALARLGGFSADDLIAAGARHPRMRGVRRLSRIAALLDPRPDSPPESRMRVMIVLAGLPRPLVRYRLRDESGGLRFELDLAWPEFRVALEYDGHDHAQADRRGRDLDRLVALRRAGWQVIVITARQLRRPGWVPELVREALCDRGWAPDPRLVEQWAAVWAENVAWMHGAPSSSGGQS